MCYFSLFGYLTHKHYPCPFSCSFISTLFFKGFACLELIISLFYSGVTILYGRDTISFWCPWNYPLFLDGFSAAVVMSIKSFDIYTVFSSVRNVLPPLFLLMNIICLELFWSNLVQKVKFFTDWWGPGVSPGSEWYSDLHWVSQDQHCGCAGSQSCHARGVFPRNTWKPGSTLYAITITMKHPSTCCSSVALCLHW